MSSKAGKKSSGLASWFEDIRADYEMSRQSRFIRRRTGVAPLGGSADYHFRTETDYYNAIEQARDMDRNDGLVGTLADRRVDNIVQQGFTLDTKTGDKALDQDLWHRWQAFANDPERVDIAGELCFHEMERFACRAESIDGDIVVIGTEDGPLQMLEAHNIATSSKVADTFCGVTRDQFGRRLQYHVRYDVNEFGQKSDSAPIEVRNDDGVRQLFHIYNPKRVSMTRGVTQLAPVFALSGMLEDINFAKLVQQQIVSCFAIFRKLAAGTDDLPSVDGAAKYGEPSSEQTGSGSRQLEGISPGMEIVGRAGEELSGFSPNVPNSEYFQQVKLILQIIGVNFGLPLCLVLMDGSETNFSGWRGAVDEARKGFVADQENLVRRFHDPVYRWWLYREIEQDAALKKMLKKSGIDIFGHKWNLPTWSYIEPVADADGDVKQLQSALTSPRRMHAARGKDWETIADEIVEDNRYAIEKAQTQANEINARFSGGPQLSWRDLIPLPMPAGQTLALQDPNALKAQQGEGGGERPAEQPSGEFAGLSTLQWNRNRKAIQKVLEELAAGTTSETAARVYLEGIGLQPKSIDALIEDAKDGTVDTPEVLQDQPTAKGKRKPKAAGQGEWRTTQDGGKIFIAPGGDPKFAGPDGPPVKKDGGGNDAKLKGKPKQIAAVIDRHKSAISKIDSDHAAKVSTLQSKHAEAVKSMRAEADAKTATIENELKALDEKQGKELEELEKQHDEKESKAGGEESPERLKLREANQKERDAIEDAMDREQQKLQSRIDAIDEKADRAEERMEQTLSDKIEALEEKRESKTADAEDKSYGDLEEYHDQEIDELAERHDSELSKAVVDDVSDEDMQSITSRHEREKAELDERHSAESRQLSRNDT